MKDKKSNIFYYFTFLLFSIILYKKLRKNNSHFHWDYIIVGAGISGAVVLEQLVEKYGKNKNILVLERQDEIGGNLKSYTRDYGNTTYTNSDDRRILELGGMRYFKEIMPNVEFYREKYNLTSKKIIINNSENMLLSQDQVKKIKDVRYFDNVSDIVKKTLFEEEFNKNDNIKFNDIIKNFTIRKKYFNNKLSSLNYESYMTPNIIENSQFKKYASNWGYSGFIDSSIAACVSTFESVETTSDSTQHIIVEGFQNMVREIFFRNGLNTKDNATQKIIKLQTKTNVEKVEDNKLITNQGIFYGDKIIWTIPPTFLKEIGYKSNMDPKVLDELENGFWDFRATKIFLFYDIPWWNPILIGKNLLDNPIGQLWVWDDKTLLIYCCDESAMYWQYILDINIHKFYGKYIDIKENLDTIPIWYTQYVLPHIKKILPIENIENLKGYAIGMWNNNVPLWKRRQSKTYGNIMERRERIRFPFGSKNHIYVTNATSIKQGWVDGSIEEVRIVFSEFDI